MCRNDLLNQIRAIEFMTVDLNLYLNTHPEDRRAINEYNNYTRQLMMLKAEYERIYGPLTNFGYSQSQYPWRWINDPWPWEQDYWMEEC
ncbi:MAG: spore coat protein CotJB [Xylanivirga thermophila]|uniref:spore coat protein CotJB n=1 Tax=Xylanivirga thermophila TaxID=2496273 RepID=UPI00101BCA82|nr:spore coat protein CotJB [Xylanivirga thermophila]